MTIHNFSEENKVYNNDTNSTVHILSHSKTNMKVVYFENDDDEYFFSFCFPTLPSSDKGEAHIVEHCTLSGSNLFPYRDPFMKLDGVSVSTYMNALTMLETTLYPASSKIYDDFKQLFEVYADAVFSPLLTKEAFNREGVSIEKHNNKIKTSGVVLSEMTSDNYDKDLRSELAFNRTIFKGTPYRFNSGGEPLSIVKLTYHEFLKFYKNHYNPSLATLVLYGKPDILECLSILDEQYLSSKGIKKLSLKNTYTSLPIDSLPFYKSPKDEICYYQKDSENALPTCTIHLLSDVKRGNPYDSWMLTLIEDILLANASSPLSYALMHSNIGGDVSSMCGINRRGPYSVLSFGLDDVKPLENETKSELLKRCKTAFLSFFENIVKNGIDEDFINASLKYYEFKVKEGPISEPKGLYITKRLLPYVIKETNDPLLYLNSSFYIEKIKNDYEKNKNLFIDFLKEHFLKNIKSSLIVTLPSDNLYQNEQNKIKQNALITYEKEGDLNIEDKRNLSSRNVLLIEKKVSASKLISLFKEEHYEEYNEGGVPYTFYKVDTNGIYYVNVLFDVSELNTEELQLLSFLSSYISHIDVGEYTSVEFTKRMMLTALGFSLSLIPISEERNDKKLKTYLLFRAKVLENDFDDYLILLSKLFFEMHPDSETAFKTALNDEKGTLLMLLNREVSSLFITEALSKFSKNSLLKSKIKGISYIQYVHSLKESDCSKYYTLLKKVFKKENLKVFIAGNKRKDVSHFVSSFEKSQKVSPLYMDIKESERRLFYSYPFGTFSNALSFKVASQEPSFDLYSYLLEQKTLYNAIRGELSAYGCGSFYLDSGEFCIYSLCDPNIKKTYDAFKKSIVFDFTHTELEDALIKTLKSLSDKRTVEETVNLAFLRHISLLTNDKRLENINKTMSVTSSDVKNIMEYLETQDGIKTTFGNEEALKKAYPHEKIVKIL